MVLCVFLCISMCFSSPPVDLTTGLLRCGVGLVGSFWTVWFAITHFVQCYTNCRARTPPLTGVTVSRVAIYNPHKRDVAVLLILIEILYVF